MDVNKLDFKKALEELRSKSKKRKFVQSLDLILNFQRVDFSKPENRIDILVKLPKGRGKEVKVAVIAEEELMQAAKKWGDAVFTKEDLEKMAGDKKNLKKIANSYDFFICHPKLMSLVAKYCGQVLGPRGKMPKPVTSAANLEQTIKNLKESVQVKTKGKFLPTLHAVVGTEEMKDEDLIENIKELIHAVAEKLPEKTKSIKSIYLKLSMSPAVKVE
ncbi:MAG: 50S ribosomal protein L1 [archaeon]